MLLGFDCQGWIEAIGGLVIGLIALYSSYDHVNLFSSTIYLNQQWGISVKDSINRGDNFAGRGGVRQRITWPAEEDGAHGY